MIKFNIFFALLSLISGVANIFVGYAGSSYSSMDVFMLRLKLH